MIDLYDAFKVNESGAYIQFHEFVEKDLVNFLRTKQLPHGQSAALCNAISHYSIQNIITLAINRYLEISAQEYMAGHSGEIPPRLENCAIALEKLYDALFPIDKDFAAPEIGREHDTIPNWILKYATQAKRALDVITSNLSDISSMGVSGKAVLGNYGTYRNSRIENVKNACNDYFYYLRNSLWNMRIGELVWDAMIGMAFDPKCWCAVVSNQVRNHDNTVSETDAGFDPGKDGFYFRNPMDSWQIQNLLEICELLEHKDLFSITIGKKNCCGQDSFLIYSSSNFNTPPLSAEYAELTSENTPELYYFKSVDNGGEWSLIPSWVYF